MTDKEYEEGTAGTNKDREPMTPAKLNAGETTPVKRDPSDQQITSEGQTGTNAEQASEEYQKKRHTKIENDS